MIEQQIDILSDGVLSVADAVCFTSNGVVKKDGTLTMGKGVAKAFRDEFPNIANRAGEVVKAKGNICQIVGYVLRSDGSNETFAIVAFPTKHHWRDSSDIGLIKQSARQLVEMTDVKGWKRVYLPRPGCANGQLDWERMVKPVLLLLLDDRFIITTLEEIK